MATLKNNLTLTLMSLLFPLTLASTNNECPNSKCSPYYNPIHYPFRTPDQPTKCGLPGFDLECNRSNNKPLLSLPSGQNFTVESILYDFRWIAISDPEACFQEKMMHFDSSGTPFYPMSFTNFTLYNCSSSNRVPSFDSDNYWSYSKIECLSGGNYSVVCDRYKSSSLSSYGCELIGDVKVAGNWTSPYRFSNAKRVYLDWDLPDDCLGCQSRGGVCTRDPTYITKTKCSAQGHTFRGLKTLIIVVTVVPICLVLLSACCAIYSGDDDVEDRTLRDDETETQRSTNNEAPTIDIGIELIAPNTNAYPIGVVGESRGLMLANLEHEDCRICLGEYEAKEIVTTLPWCLHRFHSACINRWLSERSVCPICMTPPPPTIF